MKVHPSLFKIFLTALLLSAAGEARANDRLIDPFPAPPAAENCERLFSRIDYKQNFLLAGRAVPGAAARAKAKVLELEKIKITEIFPDIVEDAPDGFKSTVRAPNMNKMRRAKYQKTFDDLMEERVKAGLFPRQELNDWRDWMKLNQKGVAYPDLVGKEILEFIEGGGTMAEFTDLQFMRYIRASKGDPIRNVGDYLSSYYPDVASRLKSYADRQIKKVNKRALAIGAPLITLATWGALQSGLGEILQAFLAPIFDPLKKGGKDRGKEAGELIVSTATKASSYLKAPDKYQEKVASLHDLQAAFEADDFTGRAIPSRAKLKESVTKYETVYGKILPEFHDTLLAFDKSFDEKWSADMKEKFGKIPSLRNNYYAQRSTLDQLSALIEQRTDAPAKPEEMNRLAYWAGTLAGAEDEISDALVTWQMYRLNVGPDKMDPVMEKEYQRLYSEYLQTMDVDKLRKKLAAGLGPIIKHLESWADKNKANILEDKPLPAPGKIPDVAPAPVLVEPPPPGPINNPLPAVTP